MISTLCVALFQPFALLFVSYRTVRSNFLTLHIFCFSSRT
nr:MAG TPA: phosphodiesterase [Caudoviricetes sp.]